MKIFQTIQKHYETLGISSLHQSARKLPLIRSEFFVFLVFGCAIFSHFVYNFHVANGFMEYIDGICAASATSLMFVCFVAIFVQRTLLFKCFANIESFINTRRKYPKSRRFFLKTNQRIERLSGIIFMLALKVIVQFIMLPPFIISMATYFITDSGPDSLQLPAPLWFPFDWKNPIGYLLAIILEYILVGYEYFIIACSLSLLIGVYWITIAVTKDIERILHSINDKAKINEHQSNELKTLFSEFIYAHANIIQVEHNLSNIFQPMFMLLFTWSLLAISVGMLIIQMEITHHGNVMPLFLLIISSIFGVALVFIACELGQRMSHSFEKININIDRLNWYLFPIEIQRMLPTITVNAQHPVKLECFGSIACTREVFQNIIHCAFSYFMVLRKIGN